MTEVNEEKIIENSQQSNVQTKRTVHKLVATLLFFPFFLVIGIAVVFLIGYPALAMTILWWIFIVSGVLSIGILLSKLSGFATMVLKVKNPVGNPYSIERISAIVAIWSLAAVLALGLLSMRSASGLVENANEFFENFNRYCPWKGWPK